MAAPADLLAQAAAEPGVRAVAALSARFAYGLMCLTLCLGVMTVTGWGRHAVSRKAMRAAHLSLATLTIVFAVVHAVCFRFLPSGPMPLEHLLVPNVRHGLGVVSLYLMVAIALSACLHGWTAYRRWVWLHRTAYLAIPLGALHSLLGALANGHLSVLWLGGITLLVPAVTLAVLRALPARTLERLGVETEKV